MFIVMIRTVILYIVVVLTMRLMGKRQIGELEPFELVIAIMISELASLPMQDLRIPLIHGIIPIITLLILQSIITILELKSEKASAIITGIPSIIIRKGKIDIKELRNQRLSFNDLIEELRLNGYYNISDIEYAILETSGQLSIIPKSAATPVTREDLQIVSDEEKLPITLILDGKINKQNLKLANKDLNWLNLQLRANNIKSTDKVFIAILDSMGNFYCQSKDEK
ncbi:YetF domain-containing protein [Clostridium sp. JNZ J1-5]